MQARHHDTKLRLRGRGQVERYGMLKSRVEAARAPEMTKPVQMEQRPGRMAAAGNRKGSTLAPTTAPSSRAEPRAFVQRQLEIGVKLEV
jgi:hypothetical protein